MALVHIAVINLYGVAESAHMLHIVAQEGERIGLSYLYVLPALYVAVLTYHNDRYGLVAAYD